MLSIFEVKPFKKGRFFKEPFKAGNHLAFLPEEAVRLIIYKENGDEITARIRQDNAFFIDHFRLRVTDSSPIGIECLENLTLLIAHIDNVRKRLEANLALNTIIRKHQSEQMLELVDNPYLFLAETSKERYQFILDNNPNLLKKFPLAFHRFYNRCYSYPT